MLKIRFHTHIAILLAALLLVAGCATVGPAPPQASPQAAAQYAHARSLYQSGDYRGAANAFLTAAEANPPLRDRATLAAAASFRSLGRLEQTSTLLGRIDLAKLSRDDTARYRVLSADVALHHGNAAAALRQLATLSTPLPADVHQHALDVEARAQLAEGNRLGAARALVERAPLLPPAARRAEHQQAIAILAGMGHAALSALSTSLASDDPIRTSVTAALGTPSAAAAGVLPQPNQPIGAAQGAAAPQGFTMPTAVALLVPATGPVANAGAAVRDGFFTAYFHSPAAQAPRPAIRVYDTGGTPDGAVAAYQQAVQDGVALVVGPLGRAAVGAIFAQPRLPVPVLALNHPQGTVPTPGGSYEFALLPEAEGAQVAAHMIALGLRAAIVFRDDSDTASRTFDAFKIQFESLGGQVANDIELSQGSVDFASQIQAALAGSGSESGIVAFLRPIQARLLLPQLHLARSTLPVFSTSMVYSGVENDTANGDLDGVQFCDSPWLYDAQAGLPDHATLAAELTDASGPAARLFAFGMDAYSLLPYLGWLRANPGSYVPGATGQLTMDAFGHVQRTPIWVQFQNGAAQPISAGFEPPPPASAPAASSQP